MVHPVPRWTGPAWLVAGLAVPFVTAAVAILAGRVTGLFAVGFFVWLGLLPVLPVAASRVRARRTALGWGLAGAAVAYAAQGWLVARAIDGGPGL